MKKRDWRIYANLIQLLNTQARKPYKQEEFEQKLDETVYALDATTIDSCLSLFSWIKFRNHNGGIKPHTLLDVQTSMPTFIELTPAKGHEVNILDIIIPKAGAF